MRHYLAILKKICRIAFKEGHSDKSYFEHYQLPKQKETPPRALSKDDFEKIRDVELTGCRPEHSIVRDMFLFACYTGTSYVDVVAITPDNLSKDDQGAPWLKYRRGKNGQLCRVKLLPEAVVLIEKYKDETRATLFPVIPYQALKWCLTSIKMKVGIKGRLSYHTSRHSFGTLMLSAGVPIESISKMMGHTSIKTTQGYAKVTDDKISEDMDKLIKRRQEQKNNPGQSSVPSAVHRS